MTGSDTNIAGITNTTQLEWCMWAREWTAVPQLLILVSYLCALYVHMYRPTSGHTSMEGRIPNTLFFYKNIFLKNTEAKIL